MKSNNQEKFVTNFQQSILLIIALVVLSALFIFKNVIFEKTFLIKNLGAESMNPEIAFINDKPTFIEFYAEWCEVCKKMAPSINQIKKDFQNDFNFVFLNVDNPKWDKYINQFEVNGIPQLNILDSSSNVKIKFIGLQDEIDLRDSLKGITTEMKFLENINGEDINFRKEINTSYTPRSHG